MFCLKKQTKQKKHRTSGIELIFLGYSLIMAIGLLTSNTYSYYRDENEANIGITVGSWADIDDANGHETELEMEKNELLLEDKGEE